MDNNLFAEHSPDWLTLCGPSVSTSRPTAVHPLPFRLGDCDIHAAEEFRVMSANGVVHETMHCVFFRIMTAVCAEALHFMIQAAVYPWAVGGSDDAKKASVPYDIIPYTHAGALLPMR